MTEAIVNLYEAKTSLSQLDTPKNLGERGVM